ncbi:MAG: hypothetical protein A2X49_02250 [Lentisphaerae bacterium GWF2_52_8]|nr:MAG: hypothetical protein A2X49_02250 [Lentisphaerae bacterium GWF2_52_8]
MIQAINRAAMILRLVSGNPNGLRLCELSRGCGLKRNTIYNLADTLVKEGFLIKDGKGNYRVGGTMASLLAAQNEGTFFGKIESSLSELHLRHKGSCIYYSELGPSGITARLHYPVNEPGKAQRLENVSLPLYLTVAGLVFLAFAGEERIGAICNMEPFDLNGLKAWGSMNTLLKQVELARKNGYSETPALLPREQFKIGLPVWESEGVLAGALTFDHHKADSRTRKEMLRDALKTIKGIRA